VTTAVVISRLRQKRGDSGHAGLLQSIQNLSIGGRISKGNYQYCFRAAILIARLAPEMRDKIQEATGPADVTTDLYIRTRG
jgi:HAE1 family hydrophobic/amphiphilic exporter-1